MSSLSQLFIPRNRKVEFDVEFIIHELTNIPAISGLYYVKWRLKNGNKRRDVTRRVEIKDHSVIWDYKLQNSTKLIIGKDGFLMPCELRLTELNGGKEINNVGKLSLNISEYVGLNTVTRRYLLQDSKINSTLKLTINMKQTFGDVVYKVPVLKKTQIFGGLAGIISEQAEQDDDRSIRGLSPNFGSHYMDRSRSLTSLRSEYQSTQAAPVVPSMVTNSIVTRVGRIGNKSHTDVVEEIFMGTTVFDDEDNRSVHTTAN
ncbi:25013_t:CDS:2 [Dentiscutata erythropus]|uniref:25013_t:CDS:1 n=1 Tax=Dentiscutata erythropus TaxID=1348616 RepID=A0A9N9HZC7_9GLOM|nr:25013_t:CDS:2 [Dentiscutata erythropus]